MLLPIVQTITLRGGRQRQVAWTDEQVTLNDYGKPVRQLSLFEHGKMVAQAISGRLERVPGRAGQAGCAEARWAEEEHVQRYDMINYGLHTLADYDADEVVEHQAEEPTRPSPPLKKPRQRPRPHWPMPRSRWQNCSPSPPSRPRTKNDKLIPRAQQKITACKQELAQAEAARLRGTPRSCPPARSYPAATRAILHIIRRSPCNWSCAFWPPTPSTTSPGTSTPTSKTTTNTAPSPGKASSAASPAPSPTSPRTSP